MPWEQSPCLAGTTGMASCPLPLGFNHAAVMHTLCSAGVWVFVAGLFAGGKKEMAKVA